MTVQGVTIIVTYSTLLFIIGMFLGMGLVKIRKEDVAEKIAVVVGFAVTVFMIGVLVGGV